DPIAGYVPDFTDLLGRLSPLLDEQPQLKVVTNAGGLNSPSCARKCAEILVAAGQGGLSLGVVTGDDLLGSMPEFRRDGFELNHMETGAPIATVADRLVSANAYLGAGPIAESLLGGARIVVTGRVADASLTLGPAVAHFGWDWNDWARLAGASAAGHLIECGAQATGGLWSGWAGLPDFAGVGYPLAGDARDGGCRSPKTPRARGA